MILFRVGDFPVTWPVAIIALIVVIDIVLVLVADRADPAARGISGCWALLRLLPVVHLIFLWVFAVAPLAALDAKR